MKTTRKRYTGEFRVRVVLDAILVELTLAGWTAEDTVPLG